MVVERDGDAALAGDLQQGREAGQDFVVVGRHPTDRVPAVADGEFEGVPGLQMGEHVGGGRLAGGKGNAHVQDDVDGGQAQAGAPGVPVGGERETVPVLPGSPG